MDGIAQPLVGGGVGCPMARLLQGGAPLKIGLFELLDAGVAAPRLRLEAIDGILGRPQVPLELAGARDAGVGVPLQHAHGLQLVRSALLQFPDARLGGGDAGEVRVALALHALQSVAPVLRLAARGRQLVLELPDTPPLRDQHRLQLRVAATHLRERGLVSGGLCARDEGSGARRLDRRGQLRALGQQPAQLGLLL